MQHIAKVLAKLAPRTVLVLTIAVLALAWWISGRMREGFAELSAVQSVLFNNDEVVLADASPAGDDDDKDARKALARARRVPNGDCPLRSQGYSHWSWGTGVCCRYRDNEGCDTEWFDNNGTWSLRVKPGARDYSVTPQPSDAPQTQPTRSNVPVGQEIPDYVMRTMGVDNEQMGAILSMIGGPEQANVHWWKGNDGKPVYGYCENINDKRGVTIGVPGFVSKYNELDQVFKTYGISNYRTQVGNPDECKPKRGCKLCDWVGARGDDPKWIAAQWKVYHDNYFVHVPRYLPKQANLNNALIKGLLLDTAMNAGIGSEGNAWGMDAVAKAARGSTPMEWVTNFCDLRYKHFTAGNEESAKVGRLLAWRTLARDGKWDMRGVNPCLYSYCYNGAKLGGCRCCPGQRC